MVQEVNLAVLTIYAMACLVVMLLAVYGRRIVKSEAKYRTEHSRAAKVVRALEVVICVSGWYAVSVSLTIFNKWLYAIWHGGHFTLPVTATAVHMVVKAITAQCLISSQWSPFREDYYQVPTQLTCLIIGPIGLATAADIVLSNASFIFITVTLYTIIKSGTLLWILLWGICLRLETCSWKLAFVCVCVSGGMALASYNGTDFDVWGTGLVLGAGCMAGVRWALSQRLMAIDETFQESPLLLIAKFAPYGAVSTVIAALVLEGREFFALVEGAFLSDDAQSSGGGSSSSSTSAEDGEVEEASFSTQGGGISLLIEITGFFLVGGILSFLLLVAEMKLLQLTSSLTMGIFGTVKEVLQVILAIVVLSEPLSSANTIGLILCICGTLAYHKVRSGSAGDDGGVNVAYGRPHNRDSAEGSCSSSCCCCIPENNVQRGSIVGAADGLGAYDIVRQADVELAGFMNHESDSENEIEYSYDGSSVDVDAFFDGVSGSHGSKKGQLDEFTGRRVAHEDGELSDGWDDHADDET